MVRSKPFYYTHYLTNNIYNNNTTTVLRPFLWDYPGEPVPEETLIFNTQKIVKLRTSIVRPGCQHNSFLVLLTSYECAYVCVCVNLPHFKHST